MFFFAGQNVSPRVRFSGFVTGTPTGRFFVNGTASGSAVNGTGSGAFWVFNMTIPSVAVGSYIELEVTGVVSGITQNKTVLQGSLAELLEASGGGGGLDAAGVRAAVGLASANLDTQLSGINSKTVNLPASPAAVGSAMTLAANAVSASAIATGAITSTKFAAGALDAVWSTTTRTLSSYGTLATDVTAIKAKTDSLTFTVAGFVDCNLYRWRGTQPGTLDANNFVPANLAAVNGNTTRAATLATALDGNYLAKLNVSGVLAHTDNAATFRADVGALLTASAFNTSVTALRQHVTNASQF